MKNFPENLFEKIDDNLSLMSQRKNDHIQICKTKNIESDGEPFSQYRFIPEALPEFNINEISTQQTFLNQKFNLPILITGMTGGVDDGQFINETLAMAAQKFGIPMGFGSQKIMIKNKSLKKLFNVRKKAPNVYLIGNLGAVSFNYGIQINDVKELVGELELNAFALHLNALQECIQPEGECNFSNLLIQIEKLCKSISVPIIVKEVGSGISENTCQKLINAGVSAIDVGGNGGTSWSAIEGHRSVNEGQRLGELFRNWGLSTHESLVRCIKNKHKFQNNIDFIATGGIRNGMQVAKAIGLGATMVGVGLPLFKSIVQPPQGHTPQEGLENELNFFKKSLIISQFCCGAKSLNELSLKLEKN